MSEDTGNFWSSLSGIATRIADLAHNFTWSSLSETIKAIFGSEPNAKFLVWSATQDDRTCDICAEADGITYTQDDPMLPDLPAHVDCRCFWDIQTEEDMNA